MKKFTLFSRVNIICAILILIASCIVGKLFLVQVVHARAYQEKANRQFMTPVAGVFDRGSIYFTEKDGNHVQAAAMRTGFKIAVDPKQVTQPSKTYTALKPYISITYDEFKQKISNKEDPYEEIATQISEDDANKILALHLGGVYLYKEKWRYYPGNDLASQVLGLVGFKGDDLAGRYGLERKYNDILGRSEENLYVNFFAEVFSNIKTTLQSNTVDEGDVITSIEPHVQAYLQKTVDGVYDSWHSEKVGGIIMDPYTGEIYAMAMSPSFDINTFSKNENPEVFSNPIVENVFEFGSVIKPLVMAGALEQGVVTPTSTYVDNKGSVTVEGKVLSNFDKRGRGTATMQQVLDQSLNTGMVYVMQQMGKDSFRKYMKGYQIGEKTGIDLPNETSGLISNLDSKRQLEYATASFGQGIALTPIEAIRAFSSLANGGKLVSPHIVTAIEGQNGSIDKIKIGEPVQVLKPETSETISRMLATVVDEGILNGRYKMEHYSIAAKTGTAQIAKPGGGGYYDNEHLHSFFGYFPAYHPKFIVFLFNVNPVGASYAATTLTEPFMNTIKYLISYYDVPPDR